VPGRRPPLPDRAEYLRRWSRLHGGASTGGLVGFWLALMHRLARPLARLGVGPDPITIAGLLVAIVAAPVASGGGRWPLLAAGLVVISGLVDNLDGAVAVLTGRATGWGFVLDSVCDRVADAGYLVALWLAGAPGWLAVLGGGLAGLQEYLRARAGAGGMAEVGVVTVAERPTRVIVTAMFLLAAGVYPDAAAGWAGAGAALWAGLGLIGFGQLAVAVRRRLRDGTG
jgi:phosphatidylglycerophosphate synthase